VGDDGGETHEGHGDGEPSARPEFGPRGLLGHAGDVSGEEEAGESGEEPEADAPAGGCGRDEGGGVEAWASGGEAPPSCGDEEGTENEADGGECPLLDEFEAFGGDSEISLTFEDGSPLVLGESIVFECLDAFTAVLVVEDGESDPDEDAEGDVPSGGDGGVVGGFEAVDQECDGQDGMDDGADDGAGGGFSIGDIVRFHGGSE
jgi:hypothetical protein